MIIDTSLVQASPDKKIQEISSEKQFVLDNIGKAMVVSADYFGNVNPRLGFDILVPKFRYDKVVHGFCQKQISNDTKGKIISKGLFGRIRGYQKSFRNYLTFTTSYFH